MRAPDGAWVGWSGATRRGLGALRRRPACTWCRSRCRREEVADYYEGFSNATLWPLYHDVIAPPDLHRKWWDAYVAVNQRFAEAAAAQAADGATVWVQDYQLQLVPAMLRELRPDLRIGFFNHIPFPGYEIFAQLPWRRQVVEGLLGADLLGFQRQATPPTSCAPAAARRPAPAAACQHLPGPGAGRQRATRSVHGARAFPISIDTAGLDELARTRRRARPGPADPRRPRRPATVLLGVDRLDYTKGILHRLQGLRRAARRRPAQRRRRRPGPGGHPEPRAGRAVPAAARRGRADRRADQRRARRARPPGGPLPPPLLPARGDGGAVPGRRRHARHVAARRHEPRRQGVRRLPPRRARRAGAQRVHRRRRRARPAFLVNPHDIEG